MRTTFCKHALVSAAASVAVLLVTGGIASAHVDPDPLAMEAGTTGTVAFTITHGCEGSPTTGVALQIPDGVTGVATVEKDGWTATVTGNTVEFTGGSLAADVEDHFEITLTAPTAAGEIRFPAIQTCEQGELAWIEVAEEGAAEPEHPAPTLKITAGPPTAEDLAAHEEEEGDTHEEEGDTHEALVTQAPDDDSSNTGTVVIVVVTAAIVLVGGGVLLARRKNAATTAGPGSGTSA